MLAIVTLKEEQMTIIGTIMKIIQNNYLNIPVKTQ
jgi:hypothetical protein